MDYNLVHPLNFNKNEAQNLLLHSLAALPLAAASTEAQIAYHSAAGVKKPYYFNGTEWKAFEGVNNFVTGVSWASGTGLLTLTRQGLGDLTVNLDGRYLTGNQNISLTGHITGSGTTAITTSLHATAITSQSDATLASNYPSGATNYMLISQSGVLKKYSLGDLSTYIDNKVGTVNGVTNFSSAVQVASDPTVTHTITGSNSNLNTSFQIRGVANQTKVTGTAGIVTIGLADNVTIPGTLTVTGNLTVNGTVTTVNTETINLADNIITLNSNYTGSTPTENAGIEINRGSLFKPSFIWDEAADRWKFSNNGTTFYNVPLPTEYTNYTPSGGVAVSLTDATKWIKNLTTNSEGRVTAATQEALPTASTSTAGIVELADAAEILAGTSTEVAVTPAGVKTMIGNANTASKYIHPAFTPANGSTTTVKHDLLTEDVNVVILNAATKEVLLAPWKVVDANNIEISVGNMNGIGNIVVKVFA